MNGIKCTKVNAALFDLLLYVVLPPFFLENVRCGNLQNTVLKTAWLLLHVALTSPCRAKDPAKLSFVRIEEPLLFSTTDILERLYLKKLFLMRQAFKTSFW